LSTLAALISGIVGSKSTPWPHLAATVPHGPNPASRVKRCARWCDNARILEAVSFLPYADVVLRHLALPPLVLVMEGRGVGRGCTALMLHVVSKGRARPLAWRVRPAPQGHLPADLPSALVDLMSGLLPSGAQVVVLGDGACDGPRLQHTLQQAGWSYACRTATSTVATWAGATCRLEALGSWRKPGRLIEFKEVHGTREAYGPILWRCCGAKGYHEPLSLVRNMATAEAACRWDEKRFRIETFFSDQKSRGFHLHKSHIADVQRLSRLFIAACLASIWVIY
jgi:hypothetical protein